MNKQKLPEGWKDVELGDEEYFTILSSGINKFGGEKDYLSTESIKETKINKIECKITYQDRPSRANMQPILNSVWFAKMQSTLKVYSFGKDNEDEINKYILSTGFAGIKINEDLVFLKYLRLLLISKDFNEWKDKLCTGSTQRGINNQFIKKISLIIPPLATQKAIVSILEKAEKSKEWRKKADDLTNDFLKSVFLEMFGNPFNSKKWEMKSIEKFGEIITGNTPPRKNKDYYGDYIDWIKSDNLNQPNTFLTESSEKLSKKGMGVGRVVPKGSVLVTCIAGSMKCIGNTAIANRDVAFNQQINAIVPNKNVNSYYLYNLISNFKTIIQSASTKSMKGMVSKTKFSSIKLPLPPISLQNKFASIVKQVEAIKEQQKHSKNHINNLFNALMQKAFKGELVI